MKCWSAPKARLCAVGHSLALISASFTLFAVFSHCCSFSLVVALVCLLGEMLECSQVKARLRAVGHSLTLISAGFILFAVFLIVTPSACCVSSVYHPP